MKESPKETPAEEKGRMEGTRVRHSTTHQIRILDGAEVSEVIDALLLVPPNGRIAIKLHLADQNDQQDRSWVTFEVEGRD